MVQRLKTHRDGLKEDLFFFCGRCAMKTIQGGVLRSLIRSWVGVGGSNWLVVGWSDGCLMWVESGPRCRCIKKTGIMIPSPIPGNLRAREQTQIFNLGKRN